MSEGEVKHCTSTERQFLTSEVGCKTSTSTYCKAINMVRNVDRPSWYYRSDWLTIASLGFKLEFQIFDKIAAIRVGTCNTRSITNILHDNSVPLIRQLTWTNLHSSLTVSRLLDSQVQGNDAIASIGCSSLIDIVTAGGVCLASSLPSIFFTSNLIDDCVRDGINGQEQHSSTIASVSCFTLEYVFTALGVCHVSSIPIILATCVNGDSIRLRHLRCNRIDGRWIYP